MSDPNTIPTTQNPVVPPAVQTGTTGNNQGDPGAIFGQKILEMLQKYQNINRTPFLGAQLNAQGQAAQGVAHTDPNLIGASPSQQAQSQNANAAGPAQAAQNFQQAGQTFSGQLQSFESLLTQANQFGKDFIQLNPGPQVIQGYLDQIASGRSLSTIPAEAQAAVAKALTTNPQVLQKWEAAQKPQIIKDPTTGSTVLYNPSTQTYTPLTFGQNSQGQNFVSGPGIPGTAANNVAKILGVDPKTPLSSITVPDLASAIIKNEGGSLPGVQNNPGNLKFVGQQGATDSKVKASDGGTFSSFKTPEAGLQALQNDLMTKAQSGKYSTLTDLMNVYSPDTPSTSVNSTVQSYVDGIKNGTVPSIAQVPKQWKDAVSRAMDEQGVQSPLGDRRYVMAANGIAANYIALPGYSLTANGMPYLERIAAANQTPGSVSDQDLLDSLTKLNTAGNAITDAQVSIITKGQSYSDWANILSNKLSTGGVLSKDQRSQITKIANQIYTNYAKSYQPIYDQVTKQFTDAGIPEQFWTIPDLNALAKASGISIPGVTDTSSTGKTTMTGPDGSQWSVPNDKVDLFKQNGYK